MRFSRSQSISNLITPYREIYLQLYTVINQHLTSGCLPELRLLVKSTGTFDWQGSTEVENVQETALAGDDADDETLEE